MNQIDPEGLDPVSSADAANKKMYEALRSAQLANPQIEHTAVTGVRNTFGFQQYFVSDVKDGTAKNSNPRDAALTLPIPNVSLDREAHTHTAAGTDWLASKEDMELAKGNKAGVDYIGMKGQVYNWKAGDKTYDAKTVDGNIYTYGVGKQIGQVDEKGTYRSFKNPVELISPRSPAIPQGNNY